MTIGSSLNIKNSIKHLFDPKSICCINKNAIKL